MTDNKDAMREALEKIARAEVEVYDEDTQGTVIVSMSMDEAQDIAHAALPAPNVAGERGDNKLAHVLRAIGLLSTPQPESVEVTEAARRVGKVLGIDIDEKCAHELDEGHKGFCDSATCPGALTEDHDAPEHRERVFKMARAALSAVDATL